MSDLLDHSATQKEQLEQHHQYHNLNFQYSLSRIQNFHHWTIVYQADQ